MNFSIYTSTLLSLAAISTGLMAGIYFAFSSFVMPAFKNIEEKQAIAAMTSINDTILRSWFMPLFFGSSIISAILLFSIWTQSYSPNSNLIIFACITYLTGMLLCTAIFNVPLNKALAKAGAANLESHITWSGYLKNWTFWNHVRMIASLFSCIIFTYALTQVS